MPLRDLALILIVVGSLPIVVARPYVGILLWVWIGFMNPHRLSWGVAQNLPFGQAVAAATLLGLLFTKQRSAIPPTAPALLLTAFWAITAASTVLALYPDSAWQDFTLFTKIVIMTFVMVVLVHTHTHVRYLLLVGALSIGFYGVKGATWTIITGGEHGWVLGPRFSFIGDNNGIGLALNMTIPLLFFLARQERGWRRAGLLACFALSVAAVPFTYSRGGFLGLTLVLSLILIRTRWKLLTIPAALAAVPVTMLYLPDRWFDRISSITEYQADASSMSRLYAWKVGFNLALDHPILGGGFRVFPHREIWMQYAPEWVFYTNTYFNAHSIYFHVLGEHGFLGLATYLALIGSTLMSLGATRRRAARLPGYGWMVDYSRGMQISLCAFLVTGVFYNMSYFDLLYFMIGVTLVLQRLLADATVAAASHTSSQPDAIVSHARHRRPPVAVAPAVRLQRR